METPHLLMQFRRHDRQACNQANLARKYHDTDGKLVATNRHKAMEQKTDSLAEYRATHGEQAACQLTVKPHPPAYKDMLRVMPGSLLLYGGKPHIMQSSTGRHNGQPDYYVATNGEKFRPKFCLFIKQNPGISFVS